MSFEVPTLPNSGSSSQCQRFHEALPLFRFRFAAVGTSPSAHEGFSRGAIALHSPASSDQHRPPVCDPIAGPRPYAYEQEHEEPLGTAHAVRYDPFHAQSTVPVSNGSIPPQTPSITRPQTFPFYSLPSTPSSSECHCLAQVAQE